MKRSLSIATAVLVACAACSGDDATDPTTTPAPTVATTTAPTVPTTDASPSTTAAPTSVAPTTSTPATSTTPPTPTGPVTSYPFPTTPDGQPDWVPILQALFEAGTNLSLEPDVDRITTYCLENSPCYDDWRAYIENLIADDAHAEGLVPDRVLSVEIAPAQGDRDPIETGAVVLTAQVEVVGNEEGARVADSNGNTLYVISRDAEPGDINEESYFLGLDAGGEWRVVQESTSET